MKPSIRNPHIYTKTRAAVEKAIASLLEFVEDGEEIPEEIAEVHKITGPGGWSANYEATPDYFLWVVRHDKDIEAMPEYIACVEAMRSDPVFSKHVDHLVGTANSMINRSAWEYIEHLIANQFPSAIEKQGFDPYLFDRKYEEMEQFCYNDTIQFKAFSPVHNLEVDVDAIDLGDGLVIRKITDAELEEMLDSPRPSQMISPIGMAGLRFGFELSYETKKLFTVPNLADLKPESVDEILIKLLTALRLFKEGNVGINFIRVAPVLETPHLFSSTSGGLEYRHYWPPTYNLKGAEVDAFREFWKSFKEVNLEHRPTLSIATTRFNYAYQRMGVEDRLIDYMIAFEALFFKEHEKGEFTHKLAVRVARLLGGSYEDRKAIAKEMTEFYDKRSAVVHGERTTIPPGFIEKVEKYLRDSIKSFLRQPVTTSHDEVVSRLDLE